MAGKLVKTKSGKTGKTKEEDKIGVGSDSLPRILVYLDDGTKIAVRPENLELLGFWD